MSPVARTNRTLLGEEKLHLLTETLIFTDQKEFFTAKAKKEQEFQVKTIPDQFELDHAQKTNQKRSILAVSKINGYFPKTKRQMEHFKLLMHRIGFIDSCALNRL